MQRELNFVPKILLCGDEAEFLSRVGQRPFKIVGRVQLSGEVDGQQFNLFRDGKILLDGKLRHINDLLNMIRGVFVADYFVFNSHVEYNVLKAIRFFSLTAITTEQFKNLPLGFFYDVYSEMSLLQSLENFSVKTLLDVDGLFAKGMLFTKMGNDFTEIDCISEEPLMPIKENFYRCVYKNFSEVGFRRYDAALIVERPPIDFMSVFVFTEKFSDRVITFARTGSELEKYISANAKNFSAGTGFRTATGTWFFLTRHKPQENFCIYVVTHKPTPHDGKLPEGYKIIHAGRALNPDIGYLGDNISDLNLYINEITALYWFWKNANDSVVGLCHYRRFFTESNDETFAYEKILTKDAALKILQDYDIIVINVHIGFAQRENIQTACGKELTALGENIIKKYMLKTKPDYLDAFDYVLGSSSFYKCNMFVTRRDVFDTYCKWLFSFIIDAPREVLRMTNPQRTMGFFCECMLSVWLAKNHLRIKELPIMEVKNI